MIFQRKSYSVNPLMAILLTVGFFIAMYYIIRGFFFVIYWAAPLLVLAVLIIDYRLLLNHFKKLFVRIRREPASGVLWLIVNILALPLVALWLLIVGLFNRKVKKAENEIRRQREGEYVDYVEIKEDRTELLQDPNDRPQKDSYWRTK